MKADVFLRTTAAFMAAMAIGVLAVGCGGGDSTSSGANGASGASGPSGVSGPTEAETVAEAAELTDDGAAAAAEAPFTVDSGTLPKSQYISQGDSVCSSVADRYEVLRSTLPKKQQENPRKSVPVAAIPPLWQAAKEFAELGAPKGDEGKAQEMVVALEAAAEGLEAEPLGGLAGPESSFAKFNELTEKYGFGFCATL
jgi:hypothetical protein